MPVSRGRFSLGHFGKKGNLILLSSLCLKSFQSQLQFHILVWTECNTICSSDVRLCHQVSKYNLTGKNEWWLKVFYMLQMIFEIVKAFLLKKKKDLAFLFFLKKRKKDLTKKNKNIRPFFDGESNNTSSFFLSWAFSISSRFESICFKKMHRNSNIMRIHQFLGKKRNLRIWLSKQTSTSSLEIIIHHLLLSSSLQLLMKTSTYYSTE